MKSSNSIKMVNVIFLVLALTFSYKSVAGFIGFETTVFEGNFTNIGVINMSD